jgi:ABC-2 type transport system permease protein
MRLFWEIAKRALARYLTYRAATLAGLTTNIFFGILRASVLLAFLGSSQGAGWVAHAETGWNAQDVVTYVALTQAVMMFVAIFGWSELMNTVYRGEVAGELLRPVGLFFFWFAQDVGRAITALLTRGLPILLVCGLIFGIKPPSHWLLLGLTLGLGLWVSFAFRFLVNLAAFWSPDARGIARFAFVFAQFASGFLMPLRFFPDWVQTALAYTPFPHIMNTIIEIYLGSHPKPLEALLLQAAWGLGLTLLVHLLLRAATRKLTILGG